MQKIQNIHLLIGLIVIGAVSIIFSYSFQKPELLVFSSLSFIFGLIIFRFGYFLAPFLSEFANIWTKYGPYEFSPSQDVLLKKTSEGYYASMFLSITLKDSSTFKSESQNLMLMQMFEKAITSLRHTTKISLIITNVDVSQFLEKLIEKRSLAEQKLSQVKPNSSQAEILKREIESYNSQIKKISSGQKPMQVLAYAQVTAFAATKSEAIQKVKNIAQQSAAILANALATEVNVLNGKDVLVCFEWEVLAPSSKEEIENELL
ncbi:MAG: hypothetical protein NC918_00685 [Candidatus Omnitrophica bacterium]|nr:hypothetical protein [Candidatus Omnitrophota bacterium]